MNKTLESVSCQVNVPLPVGNAFELFTDGFVSWWPRDYSYSREVLEAIVLGNMQGAWCFELGPDGFRCDWGRILKWNPPYQISFTWQITPKGVPQPDPNKASLVSVRFVERGAQETLVELEHSFFERHGSGAAEYRAEMASEFGWPYLLELYTVVAQKT